MLTASRDLAAGAVLGPGDVTVSAVAHPPSGALAGGYPIDGRAVAGAVRSGEILTNVRLVAPQGPDPGPGRVAVPVHPGDPDTVALLAPGMRVAVIGVDASGAARTLTDDAIVLAVPTDSPSGTARDGPLVVLGVPAKVADAVTAIGLTGQIAVRFA